MTTAAAEPKFYTSGLVRLTKPQLVGTMAGLMLTMLLAALDQTIVGTAEPRIIASLSGFDRYPWVATAYMLCSTMSIPIGARLSDLFGRKWFFLGGTALFVFASALCGAAGQMNFLGIDGMNQLIVFRGLQGIGAGVIMALVFTIVADIFAPAERGRYQGFFSGVWGFASVFGPTLGGFLTDKISWRATFYVNLPVGLIALAVVYSQFPDIRPQSKKQAVDWAGILTLSASIIPLLLALTWVTQYGWGSGRVEGLLAWSAVLLGVFLYVETKAEAPLIPLTLFKEPVIRICSVSTFVLGMGMFGVIIYLPLYMQGVLGVSATQSGTLLTPMMLGVVCGTFFGGQMTYRLRSYKLPAVLGSVLVAAGMTVFAFMTSTSSRPFVIFGMIMAGVGMGLLIPVYTVAVQNVAPRHQMGAATASTTFFRSIGSTVGVAIFGSVLLSNYHAEFARAVPPGTPDQALAFFSNPLLLTQMREQMEAVFRTLPNGLQLMQTLLVSVRGSLEHGLHRIFSTSAVIMVAVLVLNLTLKNLPLRSHHEAPKMEPPAH
ncbi:MAG: MDR family MFS transporter [Bryobacteraceae bacterium]